MGGCINIFKFFQSELSFDDLFHFWQEFPALDLQIWVQLIGLCASCCSIPACASVSDSAGRKYSTSNSGKARFSWPFFLRTQHHYTSKGIQVMSWNKSCVLLKGRGLCHWKKEKKKQPAEKFNAFVFQSSHCTFAFPVLCIKLAEIESSDRSCSQNISQEYFSLACIIMCTIPSSPSPHHDFFHTRGGMREFIWIRIHAKISLKVSVAEDTFLLKAVKGKCMQSD